jgi:hypothetical protein
MKRRRRGRRPAEVARHGQSDSQGGSVPVLFWIAVPRCDGDLPGHRGRMAGNQVGQERGPTVTGASTSLLRPWCTVRTPSRSPARSASPSSVTSAPSSARTPSGIGHESDTTRCDSGSPVAFRCENPGDSAITAAPGAFRFRCRKAGGVLPAPGELRVPESRRRSPPPLHRLLPVPRVVELHLSRSDQSVQYAPPHDRRSVQGSRLPG